MQDKFNIIKKPINNENSSDIISDYIINYFLNNYKYHPSYIFNICLYNQNINTLEILNSSLDKYTINIADKIKNLIKNEEFDIIMLKDICINYDNCINNLVSILNIKTEVSYSSFECNVLSNPYFQNFILNTNDKVAFPYNESNKNNIFYRTIFKYIINVCTDNFINWFTKLLSTKLINNLPTIELHNEKYKLYYEFNLYINYYITYNKVFNYYYNKRNSNNITAGILDIIDKTFIKIINISDEIELYNFIKYNWEKWIKLEYRITNITLIKTKLIRYISNIYDQNNIINYNFIKLLSLSIFKKDNNLIDIFKDEHINIYIINIIHCNNYEIIHNIINAIISCFYYNYKFMMENYHKNLIERILTFTYNYHNEAVILKMLAMNKINVSKLLIVLNSAKTSDTQLLKYINHPFFNTITTTYNYWNINFNNGFISSKDLNNSQLSSNLINYNEYYESINENKTLIWLPQHGIIDITYNNVNIKLLPIQYFVLELFETDNIELSIDYIKNCFFFKNYSEQFKMNIIYSLINSSLLMINSNSLIILNNNYSIPFLNLVDKIDNFILFDDKKEDFIDKETVIKSNINHYLKKQNMNFDELFNIISNNIKIFTISQKILLDTINMMIKEDYITFSNNSYYKIIY